jgi:hypothetical protein
LSFNPYASWEYTGSAREELNLMKKRNSCVTQSTRYITSSASMCVLPQIKSSAFAELKKTLMGYEEKGS